MVQHKVWQEDNIRLSNRSSISELAGKFICRVMKYINHQLSLSCNYYKYKQDLFDFYMEFFATEIKLHFKTNFSSTFTFLYNDSFWNQ